MMAYPGGPETPLATGQVADIDVEGAIAAGNAPSAFADPNAPRQSTIPPAVDPTKPIGQQMVGGGINFTTKAPNFGKYRITAQDLVPHPDPYQMSAFGRTGTKPAFNLPGPAIAARLQALSDEKAEMDKLVGQVFAEDTRPTVPPQYSRAFSNFYTQGENELRKSIAEQYGGREDLAAKAIAGKDRNNPAAHRAYMKYHRDMNDIARVMTYNVDEALANIQEMKTGERRWDQESMDASQDLIRGFNELGQGGYGDVNKLLSVAQNYDRATSLMYALTRKGKDGSSMDDHIKAFMADSFTKNADGSPGFRVDKQGRFTVLSHEDMRTAEKILDGLAEELWPRFDQQYEDKAAFRARLGQLYPVSVELKVDDVYTPRPTSSGGAPSGKVVIGEVEYGPDYTRNIDRAGVESGVSDINMWRVPIASLIDGRPEPMQPKPFRRSAGGQVNMKPTHISMDDSGNVYIIGENPAAQEIQTTLDDSRNLVAEYDRIIKDKLAPKEDKDQAKKLKTEMLAKVNTMEKRLEPVKVPLGPNIETARLYLGGADNVEKITLQLDEARKARRGNSVASPAVDETPPMKGAKKAPDGKWYVQKPDGWYEVTR